MRLAKKSTFLPCCKDKEKAKKRVVKSLPLTTPCPENVANTSCNLIDCHQQMIQANKKLVTHPPNPTVVKAT